MFGNGEVSGTRTSTRALAHLGRGRLQPHFIRSTKEISMPALLLFILIVALLFGLGFVFKALFYVAIVLFVIWLVGFFLHGGSRRWYRW